MLRVGGRCLVLHRQQQQHQQVRRYMSTNTPSLKQTWFKLKDHAKSHGSFFSVYNAGLWWFTGVLSIGSMELVSASEILFQFTNGMGRELASPMFVNLILGLVVNELLEPVRFPVAALTVAPLHQLLQRGK
ncbi:hypothetical protein BASA81_004495 [Batrachochytrium salamandrivorans]|nr:hypothetical protein BASA81_004495 [Batrachochytrium salamandrivorans]